MGTVVDVDADLFVERASMSCARNGSIAADVDVDADADDDADATTSAAAPLNEPTKRTQSRRPIFSRGSSSSPTVSRDDAREHAARAAFRLRPCRRPTLARGDGREWCDGTSTIV
jgi:hypothetical protein